MRFYAMVIRIVLLALTVLVTLSPVSAMADDEVDTAVARERFNEGVELFDKGQYDKARAAFRQAYALKPHPAVLINLAQSELYSDHAADAATHFAKFLREHPNASSTEVDAAKEGLKTAKAKIHELTLNVDVDGAEISVDGESVGQSPLADPLYLEPGERKLEAQYQGTVKSVTVKAQAGGSGEETLQLAPSETKAVAAAPAPPPETESDLESSDTFEAEIEADKGGRQPFFSWFGETPAAWVLGAVAVGGAVAGVVFAVNSKNAYNQAEDIESQIANRVALDMSPYQLDFRGLCTAVRDPQPVEQVRLNPELSNYILACDALEEKINDGDRDKLLATVGFVVAGTATAGTVLYYFLDADDGSATDSSGRATGTKVARGRKGPSFAIAPMAGAGLGGVLLSGRF